MFNLLVGLSTTYIYYDFFSRSTKNVQFFIKTITVSTVFVAGGAMVEAFQKTLSGEELFKNIYAGFANPNFLGYYLYLVTPLLFSYYFFNPYFRKKYRKERFLFFLLVGYAFILSSSRSCWNGFIFAMLFIVSRKSKALGVAILFLAIMVNSSNYIFQGGSIYQNIWQDVYESRSDAWNQYWKVALDHPIFGIGWGVAPAKATHHAHNLYLADATQSGMVSLILVMAFYLLFFSNSVQTEKKIKDPHLKAILLGATATYFGHLFYSLTDYMGILVSYGMVTVSLLPYILIALPLAIQNMYQREEEQ